MIYLLLVAGYAVVCALLMALGAWLVCRSVPRDEPTPYDDEDPLL